MAKKAQINASNAAANAHNASADLALSTKKLQGEAKAEQDRARAAQQEEDANFKALFPGVSKDGIKVESAKDLEMEAKGNVVIKGAKVDVK